MTVLGAVSVLGVSPPVAEASTAPASSISAYVACTYGVVPINTTSATTGTLITVPSTDAYQMVASPNGHTLYVVTGQEGSAAIVPVDASTGRLGTPIATHTTVQALTIAPDGLTAYFVNSTGGLARVNLETGAVQTWIALGRTFVEGMVVTPSGTTLYMSRVNEGEILAVNTSTGVVTTVVSGLVEPENMVLNPTGQSGYVATYDGVYPVSFVGHSVAAPLNVPGAYRMTFSPDGKTLYVAGDGGELVPINTSTSSVGQPIRVVSTGASTEGVAITPNGEDAWVTVDNHPATGGHTYNGAAVQVDLATGALGARIALPQGANTIIIPTTRQGPPPVQPGYDLVGSDGGVFVFPVGQAAGFFGSLPALHVVPVAPIVGLVPTLSENGYFLVGEDGGVFSFGTAPFLGSLPGEGITPAAPVTGIVAVDTDRGYLLVGRDGGVFAFGTVPFLGSLPGDGIHVQNAVGIAATPSGNGYWVVTGTGTVYGFGAAKSLGIAKGTPSQVSAIAGTPTGGGYWITTQDGAVYAYGNATYFGSLPDLGVVPSQPVVGIVRTAGTGGYWLIGKDGGVFAFGDAGYVGSLPGLGLVVNDVVGAAPT
ncbi:MAG: YncE family protein [Acidimicrobiales bacterium]